MNHLTFELFSHTQRFSNHIKDMDHAHILEHSLKPESVLKPTATWQKRKVSDD